ncbi:unnamed protein product [Microthlaspi erraticum]|uniref:Retrotransposon gag domain-containing protein n=2 Tax=Microthlaspi erraticum TaxID=1685480 RepID=A0A6D2ITW8_9BRAS|nr:unnamed protein product [Microthlaspi erraticum]
MREVSDTLWNFHLTWRSKMTRSCFLRERKLRTASSCMITEPVSDDETDESNAIKRAIQERAARPQGHSGAPPIAEPVLVQALGNGLRYESGFWEDIRIRPSPTLKDAFLRAENYIRLEQDIPQLRFDPEDPRFRLRNKRKSSSSRPEKSTHKAPRCHHESLPRRDDAPVYDGETRRNMENRAKTDRHAPPQCSFSDQEIFEIIADIRRTPLTSRLSEVPLKKRASLHLNFYDGREDPKQWITSFMTAMRRQKYTSPEEQSAHFCQALAEHLRGDALTWFSNLRADSIDSFDDLAAAFLKQHLRFALDDLVFCKTDDDTIYGLGKFGSDWEGPFRIAKVVKPGVYQLEDNLGTTSDRLWSSSDLRKFHD